jgi:hypothetical protein
MDTTKNTLHKWRVLSLVFKALPYERSDLGVELVVSLVLVLGVSLLTVSLWVSA